MTLKIYNTQARKKEDFQSIENKKVKMYVCGPTVYDLLHVGNFRGAIFFNLVCNWLEHLGYNVNFVYNYTDVDDKIINRANEEGLSPKALSEKYIAEFEKDFNSLKLRPHDQNPRATDHIGHMVETIDLLVKKNAAYTIGSEVFFAVEKFKTYGKLSHKNLEELNAGHRVDVNVSKRNPLDFVLWKPSKDKEPAWDSPWGKGRPGWHIECSSLIHALLGSSIDIHGGGIDLIFPHHENEIAQSEAAYEKPFVRYWMHNNFIQFNNEKMSKSLGNVVKGRDFITTYGPEVFKFFILSVHYRSILNLSSDQIQQAIAGLARIYSALKTAEFILSQGTSNETDKDFQKICDEHDQNVIDALNDDFNTPAAFASMYEVVRAFNGTYKSGAKVTPRQVNMAKAFKEWILKYGKMMALFQEKPIEVLKQLDKILVKDKGLDEKAIEDLIVQRNTARQQKNYKRSDEIRDELSQMGIVLHDSVEITTWEVKKG